MGWLRAARAKEGGKIERTIWPPAGKLHADIENVFDHLLDYFVRWRQKVDHASANSTRCSQ